MKEIENAVAGHYGDNALLSRILTGLGEKGLDTENLSVDDLAPFDEFHIGGREATRYALEKLPLNQNDHLLDIGCGIGGAARTIATLKGCRVTGVDLTPEFIEVAKALTDLTHLSDRISFETANALEMPFEDDTFDAGITLHAAMNITDRPALYAEIARVLKTGASLCIYDVMRLREGDITFPVPWADTPATSYLTTPEEMYSLLNHAGFDVSNTVERREFALEFFRQRLPAFDRATPPAKSPPAKGDNMAEKFQNVQMNIERGLLAPVQIMARKTK